MIEHVAELQPHRMCLIDAPGILWGMAVTDLITAVSYFAIPILGLEFVRRRQTPSVQGGIRLFQMFIAACGMHHMMGILTMFWPFYMAQLSVNVVMAAVSSVTAIVLWAARTRIEIR